MGDLPQLQVILKPHHNGHEISQMDVSYTICGVEIEQDALLAQIHLVTASIPVCDFSEAGIVAQDDQGKLPLVESVGMGIYGDARQWRPTRATVGTIMLQYCVYPRELPEGYTSSPYFDLRNEQGGMNGAGVPFILLLEDREYDLSLQWDLSDMPESSRGVWSKGEGDVTLTGTSSLLAFSYYAVGEVKTWQLPDSDRFKYYWLTEPNFDVNEVARLISQLFTVISTFFEDSTTAYRVFARKDPFKESGGGTAAADSFMFGYSDAQEFDRHALINLLAHEIVHNWPHLEETEANRTWYDEGTAEYYSVVLPYRAGITTLEDVRQQIQSRADKYYANPYKNISNEEAVDLYWKDRRTQVIPYGRGFFYLLQVDQAIRQASNGKRSVDDVVLHLVREHRQTGKDLTCEDWLEAVSQELGRDARPEFEAMSRGETIAPDEAWFEGVFRVKAGKVNEYINSHRKGEPVDSYIWELNSTRE